jgi:hypothetical protein
VRILGITKIGEDRRVYLPKSVRERLGHSVSAYVSEGRVVVSKGSKNQMDDKGRIAVNDKILEYLEANKGDMLVFLEDRGKIYLAKVDKLDVRLG